MDCCLCFCDTAVDGVDGVDGVAAVAVAAAAAAAAAAAVAAAAGVFPASGLDFINMEHFQHLVKIQIALRMMLLMKNPPMKRANFR